MGLKSDFIDNICDLFDKNLGEKGFKRYEKVVQYIEIDALNYIADKIKLNYSEGTIKSFPKPIDIEFYYNEYKKNNAEWISEKYKKPECAYCEDIRFIPVIGYIDKNPNFIYQYMMPCKCNTKVDNIKKYFDVFDKKEGGFQFIWDRNKFNTYIDCYLYNQEKLYSERNKRIESGAEMQEEEIPF